MKAIWGFFAACYCMTIHRALCISHDTNGDHIVTCKHVKCDQSTTSPKNKILTVWYFNRPGYMLLLLPFFFIVGGLHMLITKREGMVEHPPEHKAKE